MKARKFKDQIDSENSYTKIVIYLCLILLLVVATVASFYSYALFRNKENIKDINIVVGTLNYKIESAALIDNKITVDPSSTKTIEATITSLNNINSNYRLYYNTSNSNVSIGYTGSVTSSGTIDANGTKTITIKIKNSSETSAEVTFGVKGGLIGKELVLTEGILLDKYISVCEYADGYEWTFSYTGSEQEFAVPCDGIYELTLSGARGTSGSNGSQIKGYIQSTTADTLNFYVGSSSGYNGGGTGTGSSGTGGGATDVRLNGTDLSNRILVAAGGGGYSSNNTYWNYTGKYAPTGDSDNLTGKSYWSGSSTSYKSTVSSNNVLGQGSDGSTTTSSAGNKSENKTNGYGQTVVFYYSGTTYSYNGGGGGGYYGGSAGYIGTSFFDSNYIKNYDSTTKTLTDIEYSGTNGGNDFSSSCLTNLANNTNGIAKLVLVSHDS